MNKKQKKMLFRVISAAAVFLPLFVITHMKDVQVPLILYLALYFWIGWDIWYRAAQNIKNGQIFDENFLMCVATVGAFAVSEYSEAVAVMLFYQLGEWFQRYAVDKSRRSISAMMEICPEYANLEQDGQIEQVDPDDVQIGDIILIKAGEKVPLDGTVLEGESYVDTSALTGESVPRKVAVGDAIISGCVNGNGTLRVKVEKEFDDSTVTKILELVENASSRKAKVENFITRFAKYYTPIVVWSAVFLALIPPIFFHESFGEWMQRACIFLVISCPCALVISVPLGFFGGIGAASKQGILVKGSNYLEVAANIDTIVFDKTGTLTKGEFAVQKMEVWQGTQEELLEIAALAENYSDHPIAFAIKDAWGKELLTDKVKDVQEIPGHGIQAMIDGSRVCVGNEKLMQKEGITYKEVSERGTRVYVASGDCCMGVILIADQIKPEAKDTIKELRKYGVKKVVLLSGDHMEIAQDVADQLGMDQVYAELLPGDKVEKMEELLKNSNEQKKLCFVGDGMNDAPVLSRADLGIAMGSMGSDAAIEAADLVLMDDNIEKIVSAMRIARKTVVIVKQNIVFAIGVKVLVLLLGAFGMANMWGAVFADVGVAVIAILNSMRTLNEK